MGAETPVASPGVHISLLEVFAHVFLANSIAASHANSGELTGFHEPIHRHVRDPKQASNLGDGQKLSPQRGGAGGGLRGLSHAAELYQPHSEASEADEVYGFMIDPYLAPPTALFGQLLHKSDTVHSDVVAGQDVLEQRPRRLVAARRSVVV